MVPFTPAMPDVSAITLLEPASYSSTAAALRDTPAERLAELVHHLSDAALVDARRAVHHHSVAGVTDPLAVVANALVQLRPPAAGREQRIDGADDTGQERRPTMW